MTDRTYERFDPSGAATARAFEHLSDSREVAEQLNPELFDVVRNYVQNSVELPSYRTRGTTEEVLESYVAELVAISSASHLITHGQQIEYRQIMRIREFIRWVFNGLIEK